MFVERESTVILGSYRGTLKFFPRQWDPASRTAPLSLVFFYLCVFLNLFLVLSAELINN